MKALPTQGTRCVSPEQPSPAAGAPHLVASGSETPDHPFCAGKGQPGRMNCWKTLLRPGHADQPGAPPYTQHVFKCPPGVSLSKDLGGLSVKRPRRMCWSPHRGPSRGGLASCGWNSAGLVAASKALVEGLKEATWVSCGSKGRALQPLRKFPSARGFKVEGHRTLPRAFQAHAD